MNVLFIGDTNKRGTYYFHSEQSNGWIAADLDTGKSHLCNSLAIVHCTCDLAEDACEAACIGSNVDEQRYLIRDHDLIPLFRDYGHMIELCVVNEQNGSQNINPKPLFMLVDIARKAVANSKKKKRGG